MADRRTTRIAENESAFRDFNEGLERSVQRRRSPEDYAGFVCECGDDDCEVTIRLRLADYESIRDDSQLFFTCPDHDVPDVEDVVARNEDYLVVRKHQEVADLVHKSDPRSGSQ